ncbi:unnamed protein product [Arctogadus glacialis]
MDCMIICLTLVSFFKCILHYQPIVLRDVCYLLLYSRSTRDVLFTLNGVYEMFFMPTNSFTEGNLDYYMKVKSKCNVSGILHVALNQHKCRMRY